MLMSVVIPVGVFSLLMIAVITFVSCKRIRIYGGLYIFSYPPLQDCIHQLDYSKDIREQIRKFPYVPEWEFPREKILLRKYVSLHFLNLQQYDIYILPLGVLVAMVTIINFHFPYRFRVRKRRIWQRLACKCLWHYGIFPERTSEAET